jgi:hypothetical protein
VTPRRLSGTKYLLVVPWALLVLSGALATNSGPCRMGYDIDPDYSYLQCTGRELRLKVYRLGYRLFRATGERISGWRRPATSRLFSVAGRLLQSARPHFSEKIRNAQADRLSYVRIFCRGLGYAEFVGSWDCFNWKVKQIRRSARIQVKFTNAARIDRNRQRKCAEVSQAPTCPGGEIGRRNGLKINPIGLSRVAHSYSGHLIHCKIRTGR